MFSAAFTSCVELNHPMSGSKDSKPKLVFKMSTRSEKVELTFLSSVPKKYCCCLCQELLHEPCLVSCCKSAYCGECVERLEATFGKCTNSKCSKNGYSVVRDGPAEDLRRKIQQLKVYCIKRKEGCKWSGTIEQLESSHISATYNEKDTSACQYQSFQCPNECGATLLRGRVREHRNGECPREMSVCEECGMEDSKSNLGKEHRKVCPAVVVECPNKCKTHGIARADMREHMEERCPLRTIPCDYRHVGCNAQLLARDLPKHGVESYQRHLELMSEKLEFVTNENHDLRLENESLHEEIASLMSRMKDCQSLETVQGDSYIFMESVKVRPTLPSIPPPAAPLPAVPFPAVPPPTVPLPAVPLSSVGMPVESVDGQSQLQTAEGNESGYGSMISTVSSRKSVEKIPEKTLSGLSLGFKVRDSPNSEESVGMAALRDEGNVYEDLDDEMFDNFRAMGGAKGDGQGLVAIIPYNFSSASIAPPPELPVKTHLPRSSGANVTTSGLYNTSSVSSVPMPETSIQSDPSEPSGLSDSTNDIKYSVYDVPTNRMAKAQQGPNLPRGTGETCQQDSQSARSPPAPASVSEQEQQERQAGQSNSLPHLPSIYEDLDQVVEGSDYLETKKGSASVNSSPILGRRQRVINGSLPAESPLMFSAQEGNTDAKKFNSPNIPVIQLQLPHNGNQVLTLLEDTSDSDSTSYENASKIARAQRDQKTTVPPPRAIPRRGLQQQREGQQPIEGTRSASPIAPTVRSRTSTVGNMRSLKNIKISPKLLDAVKPSTSAFAKDLAPPPPPPRDATCPTDSPVPPPRASPRPGTPVKSFSAVSSESQTPPVATATSAEVPFPVPVPRVRRKSNPEVKHTLAVDVQRANSPGSLSDETDTRAKSDLADSRSAESTKPPMTVSATDKSELTTTDSPARTRPPPPPPPSMTSQDDPIQLNPLDNEPPFTSKPGLKPSVPKPRIEQPKATPPATLPRGTSKGISRPPVAPRPAGKTNSSGRQLRSDGESLIPVLRDRARSDASSRIKQRSGYDASLKPLEVRAERSGSDVGPKFRDGSSQLKHFPLRSTASLPLNVQPSLIKELASKLQKSTS